METFVKIIKKMYWLGVIGFLGTFLDIPVLRLCYLFFLLAIVDFVLSFIIVIRRESTDETTSALKFLFQNIGMLIGIPVIYVRNLFFLPNIRNYKPQTLYNLPFLGCCNRGKWRNKQRNFPFLVYLQSTICVWFFCSWKWKNFSWGREIRIWLFLLRKTCFIACWRYSSWNQKSFLKIPLFQRGKRYYVVLLT